MSSYRPYSYSNQNSPQQDNYAQKRYGNNNIQPTDYSNITMEKELRNANNMLDNMSETSMFSELNSQNTSIRKQPIFNNPMKFNGNNNNNSQSYESNEVISRPTHNNNHYNNNNNNNQYRESYKGNNLNGVGGQYRQSTQSLPHSQSLKSFGNLNNQPNIPHLYRQETFGRTASSKNSISSNNLNDRFNYNSNQQLGHSNNNNNDFNSHRSGQNGGNNGYYDQRYSTPIIRSQSQQSLQNKGPRGTESPYSFNNQFANKQNGNNHQYPNNNGRRNTGEQQDFDQQFRSISPIRKDLEVQRNDFQPLQQQSPNTFRKQKEYTTGRSSLKMEQPQKLLSSKDTTPYDSGRQTVQTPYQQNYNNNNFQFEQQQQQQQSNQRLPYNLDQSIDQMNGLYDEMNRLKDNVFKLLQTYNNEIKKKTDQNGLKQSKEKRNQLKRELKRAADQVNSQYQTLTHRYENDLTYITQKSMAITQNTITGNLNTDVQNLTKREQEITMYQNLVEEFLDKFNKARKGNSLNTSYTSCQSRQSYQDIPKVKTPKYGVINLQNNINNNENFNSNYNNNNGYNNNGYNNNNNNNYNNGSNNNNNYQFQQPPYKQYNYNNPNQRQQTENNQTKSNNALDNMSHLSSIHVDPTSRQQMTYFPNNKLGTIHEEEYQASDRYKQSFPSAQALQQHDVNQNPQYGYNSQSYNNTPSRHKTRSITQQLTPSQFQNDKPYDYNNNQQNGYQTFTNFQTNYTNENHINVKDEDIQYPKLEHYFCPLCEERIPSKQFANHVQSCDIYITDIDQTMDQKQQEEKPMNSDFQQKYVDYRNNIYESYVIEQKKKFQDNRPLTTNNNNTTMYNNKTLLQETFYNVNDMTCILQKLDTKIQRIVKNMEETLMNRKIQQPKTYDILKTSIEDLKSVLKKKNPETMKRVMYQLEKNLREMEKQNQGLQTLQPDTTMNVYFFLKGVHKILEQKNEKSMMLNEISAINYLNTQPNSNNNNKYNPNQKSKIETESILDELNDDKYDKQRPHQTVTQGNQNYFNDYNYNKSPRQSSPGRRFSLDQQRFSQNRKSEKTPIFDIKLEENDQKYNNNHNNKLNTQGSNYKPYNTFTNSGPRYSTASTQPYIKQHQIHSTEQRYSEPIKSDFMHQFKSNPGQFSTQDPQQRKTTNYRDYSNESYQYGNKNSAKKDNMISSQQSSSGKKNPPKYNSNIYSLFESNNISVEDRRGQRSNTYQVNPTSQNGGQGPNNTHYRQIQNEVFNTKMEFFDIAKQIRSALPKNHPGQNVLISELYSKAINENIEQYKWKAFIEDQLYMA